MPDEMKEDLDRIIRVTSKMGVREGKKDIIQITLGDVRDIRKDLMADLTSRYNTLEDTLNSLKSGQEQILKATDRITSETSGINASTKELESRVTKVTDATDQIASTTRSYRDAILAQPHGTTADLKLKDDLERKAKQILVGIHGDTLDGKSHSDIVNRANDIISGLVDMPERPEKVQIELATITRSKALLLQMNTKQAADWLRDPLVETKFTELFAKDSYFIDRTYSVIVPRTPIIFEPADATHLREVEEANDLIPNSIKKARWIKPIARRRDGQTHAYAILTLKSPSAANHLIRNGIKVCGVKLSPSKLKQEPLQCLRCRGWGHIAMQCQSDIEVCGACSENHSTRDCSNPHKRICATCKDNTHASWDRNCPAFIQRCEAYNNRFPENNLPFFPTDEDWTLTTRPDKIPFEKRFPPQYAVTSLPITVATRNQSQSQNKAKRRNPQAAPVKRRGRKADAAQGSNIERFLTRSQPLTATSSSRVEGALPAIDYRSELAGPSNPSGPSSVPQTQTGEWPF